MALITLEQYLKGRDAIAPLTSQMQANAERLLQAVNDLLKKSKLPFYGVSSGYRPAQVNSAIPGAAKKSAHMTCEAIDLRDPNGKIGAWCLANIETLVSLGLYLESPTVTKNWVHLQTRPTKNRVFLP